MRFSYIFFGYPLAEILAAFLLAQVIGWGWTLALLLAGIPTGIIIMRVAGIAAFGSMRDALGGGRLPDGAAGAHGLTFLAGALIAIPGLCTDLVGLLVLIPLIKENLRLRLARRLTIPGGFPTAVNPPTQGSEPSPHFAHGDVILGEVVYPENGPAGPADDAGPASYLDSH